mmetsp:Transcript_30835/g.92137  ORF Transcript_30835/g.92137 Transcript_30835/m.92137 type:complete len:210 (-) Transcript_30835:995-1624(-)
MSPTPTPPRRSSVSIESRVVLPAPDGPSTASTWPARTHADTSRSSCFGRVEPRQRVDGRQLCSEAARRAPCLPPAAAASETRMSYEQSRSVSSYGVRLVRSLSIDGRLAAGSKDANRATAAAAGESGGATTCEPSVLRLERRADVLSDEGGGVDGGVARSTDATRASVLRPMVVRSSEGGGVPPSARAAPCSRGAGGSPALQRSTNTER